MARRTKYGEDRIAESDLRGVAGRQRCLTDLDGTTDRTQYTDEELRFLQAIDAYKRDNHRPFPTWREVLSIVHALGYTRQTFAAPCSRDNGVMI